MFGHTEKRPFSINRRHFLKVGLATSAGALFASRIGRAEEPGATNAQAAAARGAAAASAAPSKVALTNGDNRTDNIFRALKSLEREIAPSIGNRRVIIKPNNVSPDNQLASTHAEATRLGAARVLDKPFDLNHLRAMVLELVPAVAQPA